jgi:hypothetical protein
MSFTDFNEAIVAAHAEAKKNGYVAYAVQWPLGHSTVETRKPSLRDQRMRVVECFSNGDENLA